MAKNLLVINVDIRETRVALIENGIIAELHIERESSTGTLGNIYLGKVSRVLPGMQAAFIDVGLERAAFLHVEDLIRPDDFEAYLAGRRHPSSEVERGGRRAWAARPGEPRDEEAEEDLPAVEAAEADQKSAELGAVQAGGGPYREVPIELPTALDVLGSATAVDEEQEPLADVDEEQEPLGEEDDERGEEVAEVEADDTDVQGDEPEEDAGEEDEAVEVTAPEADEAVEVEAAEPEAYEDAREGVDLPAYEAAPAPGLEAAAAQAIATPDEVPPVARARTGRTRSRREGRVRRSGRTRDRRVELGIEAEPDERAVTTTTTTTTAATERTEMRGREGGREARDKDQRGREARDKGREKSRDGRDKGRDGRDKGRDGRDKDQRGRSPARARSNEPPRISKSTPIREVIREGQEIMVQISKEPIGSKGARVTSHISLPGRYVVYLPTVDHIGISKRIGSEKERSRLRDAIESMKPPQGGLIVRTLAEGLTKKQLKADVGYLVRLWGEIAKKRESGVRAPQVLYTELDLVLKTARDLFTDDIAKIVIDDRDEYVRLRRFVEMFMPERADAVELYEGEEPIFDAYGIEDEIQRALARKVPLPSGGYLIIDQAEALTAIDVNTGRFVGKGSKDLEETILSTNLEAVEEIAYQLRFRNIGGLIILDLIDMERAQNREKVRKRLEELLARDKAKTTLNRISDLGLIEMTRKRTRESLGQMILEPCFYCDGTGQLQSKQTIAYEILRQIRRERYTLPGYSVVVNAHPAVIDLLKSDERVAVQEAERRFQRRIDLVPRKEYHLEQFDLQGR
ncbi:MAG TPA: Rne/Rng family ribonuclease [Candidatus Nanopelagicales bacterium]|nr:Rne/Rng family ribonuclease [Candidatus Nanopelagicales bacterium]